MSHKNRLLILILIQTLLLPKIILAQEVMEEKLRLGKMWITCLPNGALEKDMSTENTWELQYPGYYAADNEVAGGWDASRIYNVAQAGGEDIGWFYRNMRTSDHITAIKQTELIKNHNLQENSLLGAEEYIRGTFASKQYDRYNNRHLKYKMKGRVYSWSFPGYNDFIIIECTLINTDDVAFDNFYYARKLSPEGPDSPLHSSWDMEYLWDNEVSSDIGFIFYDDTSWPPPAKGDSSVYTEFPGTITGDRGDPGNIETVGSIDRKLYKPSIYAFSFCKIGLTPNKNGEKKVWRKIFSDSDDAPDVERFPGNDQTGNYGVLLDLLQKEQPEVSWREAHQQNLNGAGSLWEREPAYLYAIGPYSIAPGDSIHWFEIFIAGQMDRNITVLGDTSATKNFVTEGLKNIKNNWANARQLIDSKFNTGDFYGTISNVPPPPPAHYPRMGYENELNAESGSKIVNGINTSGIHFKWDPVHVGYTDPLTGEADFGGYIIYQSNISKEGPWIPEDTISVEQANILLDSGNGKIKYFQPTEVGIPYYYCVTSFDNHGNESIKKAFTYETLTAERTAKNKLDLIRVVPNPFRQESGLQDQDKKKIAFVNIPDKCTIRIYTVALDLVRKIEHDGGGEESWGSYLGRDYMLTDFAKNVSPGIYIYHVESHVEGHEGDSKVGKIFIIK